METLGVIPFEFEHVPTDVASEVREALACFQVGAFNGFAAVCRRAIQAACGSEQRTTRLDDQVKQLFREHALDDETQELVRQVVLSGHDGAHSHLPPVTQERAQILLELVRIACSELYTKPGRMSELVGRSRQARDEVIRSRSSEADPHPKRPE